jgi:hypothetical protein
MLFAYVLELQVGVTISSNCMPDTTTDIELQWHDQFRTGHNKNIDLSNARDFCCLRILMNRLLKFKCNAPSKLLPQPEAKL